ncbi:uncharacterized protein EDB91DRAFT_1128637 [Suillus paluster]|uniref:uncharacterized protein n=1 Tax=Suillus paluster TaxID=48578 RepID=UPI001B87D7B5|nr:uncharacterized protein EDB91DRAFT_1128637 [Suillus paluster]KAG1742314.1 hypothetical protein EDB91DRAFT_1128637 [Suillus paluster]
MIDHIGIANDQEQSLYIPANKMTINPQSFTICRYYAIGDCRRGSSCRFVHAQPASVQQEYPYANGYDEVQARTPREGWYQNNGHSRGYATYPMYTVVPYARVQDFDASREIWDNFSDFSSSNDSATSDQSLNTAFEAMTFKEPPSLESFPSTLFYESAFSQSSPSLQYPNNTATGFGDVTPPSHYRGHTQAGSKTRASTRRKAEEAMNRQVLHKTKPCKFFSARKTCAEGDKCRFIHDIEKCKQAKKAGNKNRGTGPPHLPPKPRSLLEEFKARDYYPITWRVIGGGVMMGGYRLPCKAFAAGYCPNGTDCKLAHETELETSTKGIVHLKTRSSAPPLAASPFAKTSVDSSADSKRRTVSTDCSGSSRVIQDAPGSTSGSAIDAEEPPSDANSSTGKFAISSQHRRTRSMSMPSSPSVLRASHIFAES